MDVGCAVIVRRGKILIARRPPHVSMGGYWEFPGGKKEVGESIEECLIREVREELDVEILPQKFWREKTVFHGEKPIRLFFYWCRFKSGEPKAKECSEWEWVLPQQLKDYSFLPADLELIQDLECCPPEMSQL